MREHLTSIVLRIFVKKISGRAVENYSMEAFLIAPAIS